MPGLVPGIQVFLFQCSKAWMAGTSPAMTKRTWHELNVSAWSRIQKARDGFRRGLNSCDAEHMPVICPTCQILFSKNDFAGNARRPRLDMRSKDISRELMAKYRIG